MWEVAYTDEFGAWWSTLPEAVHESVAHDVGVLEEVGPGLGRPTVGSLVGSRFPNMKELRTKHRQHTIRILFAFDPRRCAILLIGGDKSGDGRSYDRMIPLADRLYENHLEALASEEHDDA